MFPDRLTRSNKKIKDSGDVLNVTIVIPALWMWFTFGSVRGGYSPSPGKQEDEPLGISVLGTAVLQHLPMWCPIKVCKTVSVKSLWRSYLRGNSFYASPVMKIISQLAVSSLLYIRHISPWHLSKMISRCQSYDVCTCIYMNFAGIWSICKTGSETSPEVGLQTQCRVAGCRHEFSFLSSEVDVLTGLPESSYLLQPTQEFGHMRWYSCCLKSKYFSSLKMYCTTPNQQSEDRVCLILQTVMLPTFLFTAIPSFIQGSESCKHES